MDLCSLCGDEAKVFRLVGSPDADADADADALQLVGD